MGNSCFGKTMKKIIVIQLASPQNYLPFHFPLLIFSKDIQKYLMRPRVILSRITSPL